MPLTLCLSKLQHQVVHAHLTMKMTCIPCFTLEHRTADRQVSAAREPGRGGERWVSALFFCVKYSSNQLCVITAPTRMAVEELKRGCHCDLLLPLTFFLQPLTYRRNQEKTSQQTPSHKSRHVSLTHSLFLFTADEQPEEPEEDIAADTDEEEEMEDDDYYKVCLFVCVYGHELRGMRDVSSE